MPSCTFILVSGKRKGQACGQTALKHKPYCSRHNQTAKLGDESKETISSKFISTEPFPFGICNFVVPCCAEFLDIEDLYSWYLCSSDISKQIMPLWRVRAISIGLLPVDTDLNGLIECWYLQKLKHDDRPKSYKTYVMQHFNLTAGELAPLLEPINHRKFGKCHLVNTANAFIISSFKHGGYIRMLDAVSDIENKKEERVAQKMAEQDSRRRELSDKLKAIVQTMTAVTAETMSSTIERLRNEIDSSKWSNDRVIGYRKHLDRFKGKVDIANSIGDIIGCINKSEMFESAIRMIDRFDNVDSLRANFEGQKIRLAHLRSLPGWAKGVKLSDCHKFLCKSFVRGDWDGYQYQTEDAIKAKIIQCLDEETWLRANTEFTKIKERDLEQNQEYLDAICGYGSEGWQSGHQEADSALVDGTTYEFKKTEALKRYVSKRISNEQGLEHIPVSMRSIALELFKARNSYQKFNDKYGDDLNLDKMPLKLLDQFDAWISKALTDKYVEIEPARYGPWKSVFLKMCAKSGLNVSYSRDSNHGYIATLKQV